MADNAGAHLKETIDREIARSARRHADLQARLIGYEIAVAGIAHRLAPLIPAPMVTGSVVRSGRRSIWCAWVYVTDTLRANSRRRATLVGSAPSWCRDWQDDDFSTAAVIGIFSGLLWRLQTGRELPKRSERLRTVRIRRDCGRRRVDRGLCRRQRQSTTFVESSNQCGDCPGPSAKSLSVRSAIGLGSNIR
jgi:hypothetical protein